MFFNELFAVYQAIHAIDTRQLYFEWPKLFEEMFHDFLCSIKNVLNEKKTNLLLIFPDIYKICGTLPVRKAMQFLFFYFYWSDGRLLLC